MDIEVLKFKLQEKKSELDSLRKDIFTYNPNIKILTEEIAEIENQIFQLENGEDVNENSNKI